MIRKVVLFALFCLVISGCAMTRTKGNKLAQLDEPIAKIDVVFVRPSIATSAFNTYNINNKNDQLLEQMATQLPNHLPAVFAQNHIETKFFLRKPGVQFTPDITKELNDSPYLLEIVPTFGGRQGTLYKIEMKATITDQRLKKEVWRGAIEFTRHWTRSFDEGEADNFAQKIIAQLREDGVIRSESN